MGVPESLHGGEGPVRNSFRLLRELEIKLYIESNLSYFSTGGGFVLNNWLVPQANM